MRAVFAVLGIALAVLGITVAASLLSGEPQRLSRAPQEDAWRREEKRILEEQRRAAAERAGAVHQPGYEAPFKPPREGVITATMTVENRGDVVMELYPKAAPKTVAQFARLMREGFYDGLLVHRVEPGFVLQAGNPNTRTQGVDAAESQPPTVPTVPFERNNLGHVTGSIGVALTQPQSATGTSQFFINLKANHYLDGNYCVIGKVVQGMDVVGRVQRGDRIARIAVK